MRYRIYQIKNIKNCIYAFRPYRKELLDMSDYDVVWCGVVDGDKKREDILEDLFEEFNLHLPIGCHSRSLSVSDVVEFELDDGTLVYYYCNPIGWKKIEVVQEEPTKTDRDLLLQLRHDIETIGYTIYGNDPTIFVPYNEVIRRINKYIDECK